MNDKRIIHNGIVKIVYSMITQFFILICSLIIGFVLPKYMGTTMFGYWQIYYFYLGYVNLATLGFNDGFALRYGGREQAALPYVRIRGGNTLILQLLIVITLVFTVIINMFVHGPEVRFIYTIIALSMPCVCLINIIVTIFLSINNHAVYNRVNLANKLISTIIFCVLLYLGIRNYSAIIISDFIVRIGITIFCAIIGYRFLFGKKGSFRSRINEVYNNCSIGIFITAGALASAFIPMAGRVIIEHNETIEVYGIYSFAISLLSIIITFTNTAGMVFFPILKKFPTNRLPEYYKKLKLIYKLILYFSLFAYIPIVLVINHYLFEYKQVLSYAFILFAMCIPLGKVQTLITTYYKALRIEKHYFIYNVTGAIIMFAMTWLSYKLFASVFAVAVITTVVFTIWSSCLEIKLMKKMGINIKSDIVEEVIMMFIFVILAGTCNLLVLSVGYLFVFIFVVIINYNNLKQCIHEIR